MYWVKLSGGRNIYGGIVGVENVREMSCRKMSGRNVRRRGNVQIPIRIKSV